MTRRLLVPIALLASGCALGPNYKRPEVPAPPSWRDLPAAEAESLANTAWWELFDDAQLQELIRIALVENKDLKIAVERIEEARARYGFTKADLWPKLDLSGTAGRLRFSEASLLHTPDGDRPASRDTERSIYAVSADVSWEIDFFGRIRRASEAQNALFLGTQEARRATVLALVADVARAYFELRDLDLRLEVAKRTIESRREYLQLAKDRFEGGITAEIDYRQAEAELRRVEVILFDLERGIALKENEISVLLGRNPGPIARGRPLLEQKLPTAVPAGLPSTLLDRRPDLREAEQTLAAATANIGEAKALLFPRIALTGSYGFASTEFDTLFEGPSKSWNILGNLLQPIFHFSKNKRRVQITESRQRQLLYTYERAILQAFRETEDALVTYRKTGEQRTAQGDRVRAERKVLELAELRYRGGVAAYLEVLDAQRSLFNAELDETQTIGSNLVSLVRLYKALGGGWPPAAEAASSTGAGQ
ncbi:MAG TPA: efflux transporter outer membrane subunit [Vicinamibacteria bacterium]|nr:efflux transporter outer membrane subunit [Vicinamibacteria bacterium]